jgi:nucleoside-diphosphate-sugar epimerase
VQYFSKELPLFRRKSYFFHNNTIATKNLTERYSRTGTHFVYISSSMIYEQHASSYRTYDPKKAIGPYSASKIAAQEFVEQMVNPVAVIVPCIIGGRGRAGLFGPLVRSMKKFGIAPLPGSGAQSIHVVHVQDVASLASLIIEQRICGCFHAADPDPLSIQEWIEQIAAELNLTKVKRIQIPITAIGSLSRLFGYRLLSKEQLLMLRFPHVLEIESSCSLGWQPRWNNAQTIRETASALNG